MRLRLGHIIAAVFATLLSTISPTAHAFGGYASAPLSVSATAIAGGVRVAWSAPTDVDTGVTGYRVEYSTSGTSGTWTLATTTGSSTTSYDIVGLSQVATYVRVAATTTAGTGTYGYPWSEVYRTVNPKRNSDNATHTYVGGYGLDAGDAAALLNNTTSFTRVRYRMEATINSSADYAETDFYKWSSASITTLQVPSITGTGNLSVQTNVSDLNVYSANSRVTKASGISGRIELWALNYSPALGADYAYGDANKYDYNDTNNGNGAYGSFQVHDLTNSKTVFAWNHQNYTGNNDPDVGFGSNPNTNGHPDWTFCAQNNATNGYCQNVANFKLQVFINLAVTPLADAVAPTVSRIDSRSLAKNGDTVTVRSNELGTVYLVNQAVSVSSVASITAASSSNKNSISISSSNTNTVLTLSSLNDGLYNLYAADSFNNLSTAIIGTIRVDNTAPTATSIAVGSAGTTVVITGSETLTNSMSLNGIYTISDSGSAVSVTSVTFLANTATLNLSRAIPTGATVSFTYNPLAGDARGRIVDSAGNELAAISTRVITNNSTLAITLTLTVPTTVNKGSSVTISVEVTVAGKVTFYLANKRIAGCLNKVASGTTPITVSCVFKPSLSAMQTLRASFVPTLSAYPTLTASVNRFILKRATLR